MSSPREEQPFLVTLKNAGMRALGGGVSGAAAMSIQVTSLMWMRTTMNYQYRHGMSTSQAMRHLYNEGGVLRFYRGYVAAMAQGPLSRFGDTAANAGVLSLLNNTAATRELPVAIKTMAASAAAAGWRIFLMPIDTVKTILQVEGKNGMPALRHKLSVGGVPVLYHGALAASGATFVGHYPWFFTYNYLDAHLPKQETQLGKLGRRAFIGFTASVVSDTISNSVRVVKTTKQTHTEPISYPDAVRLIIKEDGMAGLFGRGLKTRILTNGMQGLLFSVLWKYFEDTLFKK